MIRQSLQRFALVLLAAIACAAMHDRAFAAASATLDINVSINTSKEVLIVGATTYDYGALGINISSNSATAITVQNNSTALIETYTIKGSTALSQSGGTDWTLASSTNATGVDTYALAAQFSSSRPTNAESDWTQDDLNKDTAVTATTTILGDGTPGDEGAGVLPGQTRSLWFRIKTPTAVNDAGPHTARITLSVL